MRVLYVGNFDPFETGGTRRAFEVVRGVRRYGVEPYVLHVKSVPSDFFTKIGALRSLKEYIVVKRSRFVAQVHRDGVKRLVKGLKGFMEILNELDLADNTVILVTSDHGELLGEYGLTGHAHAYPYDELIHVPLMIYDPLSEGRMEVEKIFSLKDIYRLILGYALNDRFPTEFLEELPDYVVFEIKH